MRRTLCLLFPIPLAIGCGEPTSPSETRSTPEDDPVSLPLPEQGYQMVTPSYEVPEFS